MEPSLTEPVAKRADQLVVGDRILPQFLPAAAREPGEAQYVKVYTYVGKRWVFVAFLLPDGLVEAAHYLPDREVEVIPGAPIGHGHSRADDGGEAQPIVGRIDPHFESGRVVETFSGRPKVLFEHEERSGPAPSYLFGLDAGAMGQHSDGCEWPQLQCIGHASAV